MMPGVERRLRRPRFAGLKNLLLENFSSFSSGG
jgi:hypothetical protein